MLWKVKVENGKIARGLGLKARGGTLILGTSHSTFKTSIQHRAVQIPVDEEEVPHCEVGLTGWQMADS